MNKKTNEKKRKRKIRGRSIALRIIAFLAAFIMIVSIIAGLYSPSTWADEPVLPIGDIMPTSRVVFETVKIIQNRKTLTSIMEDTGPFDVEIVFSETGYPFDEMEGFILGDVEAFFVPGGSFTSHGTTNGHLTKLPSAGMYMRYGVKFSNIEYTGSGNKLDFRVFYPLYATDYSGDVPRMSIVAGEGVAILPEVVVATTEPEEVIPGAPVPKIILDSYSYGERDIVAGEEFDLNFTIRNTNLSVPLENIVITLSPSAGAGATKGPGLLLSSSSNTIYLEGLDKGASKRYTVGFKARPDAEVTSHLIDLRFSYEYINRVKNTRELAEISESVAIPVSQLDRFSVDAIAETVYGQIGQEAYLTVNFVNLGKSTTYNITASVSGNPALTAQNQHFGNLEAGESDSLDLLITANEPGEFSGEVVVKYEDGNNDEKELSVPFNMYVEEAWTPPKPPPLNPGFDPGDSGMSDESAGRGAAFRIVMVSLGSVAIFAPIMLYTMKITKRKSEENDEDF